MMIRNDSENISSDEVIKLKQESCEDSRVLLGWQIFVPGSNENEQGSSYTDRPWPRPAER